MADGQGASNSVAGRTEGGLIPPGDTAVWKLAAEPAVRLLGSTALGLDATEAARRLTTYGPNRVPEKPARSPWVLAFSQLKGFLNVTLSVTVHGQ